MSGVVRLTRIYLDTHVAIWIVEKKLAKFPRQVLAVIKEANLYLPAMVRLELQVLSEIGKLKLMPQQIIDSLHESLSFQVSAVPFSDVCEAAQGLSWTRDVFDRMIVAETMCGGGRLITADTKIHEHYPKALW